MKPNNWHKPSENTEVLPPFDRVAQRAEENRVLRTVGIKSERKDGK